MGMSPGWYGQMIEWIENRQISCAEEIQIIYVDVVLGEKMKWTI